MNTRGMRFSMQMSLWVYACTTYLCVHAREKIASHYTCHDDITWSRYEINLMYLLSGNIIMVCVCVYRFFFFSFVTFCVSLYIISYAKHKFPLAIRSNVRVFKNCYIRTIYIRIINLRVMRKFRYIRFSFFNCSVGLYSPLPTIELTTWAIITAGIARVNVNWRRCLLGNFIDKDRRNRRDPLFACTHESLAWHAIRYRTLEREKERWCESERETRPEWLEIRLIRGKKSLVKRLE